MKRQDGLLPTPTRDDMQKLLYLHERSTIEAMIVHFGNAHPTFVGNETRLGPSLIAPGGTLIPDCRQRLSAPLRGLMRRW